MSGDEAFHLTVHSHVARHALEDMAPAVIGLDADRNAEAMNPFADPLGHLVELRMPHGAATTAFRIVEQRLLELPSFFHVVEEFLTELLLDHVRMDRDPAPSRGLLERWLDHHAPDAARIEFDVVGIETGEFVDPRAAIGTEPRQPAAGRGHLDRNEIARGHQRGRQDALRLLRREALPRRLLLLFSFSAFSDTSSSRTRMPRNGFWSSLRRSTMKDAVAESAAIQTLRILSRVIFFPIRWSTQSYPSDVLIRFRSLWRTKSQNSLTFGRQRLAVGPALPPLSPPFAAYSSKT